MARLSLLILITAAALAQRPSVDGLKEHAFQMVEARRTFTQVAVDSIFSFSELGFQEFQTAGYITGLLEKEGFRITRGVAGMPTAFVAEWGSGKPVIGFMSDIDGLPETSQKPGVAYQDPLIPGGPGHGEGHNAGQAVNVTAAIVVKDLLAKYKIPGTIRVYPGVAEELLGSRNYMVRAGLFRDLDAMLSCHVSSDFSTSYGPSGTALVSTQFTFHGRSAHSAGSPWMGRSALDAVELMNVAWNYRREHLPLDQRSHYVITHGGDQPNVVPPLATVWYFFRQQNYEGVKELHALGAKIARAAAEMTDTTMTERVLAGTWQSHMNKPLAETLFANIKHVAMPAWSEEDQTLARAAQKELGGRVDGLKTTVTELRPPGERAGAAGGGSGSDDIAEVSWNLPTVNLRYPSNIPNLVGHHWSSGIAMATPIAHKGATAGAKAQAMTAVELFTRPELLEAARAYFREQTKETKWQSLVPEGANAPIELNRERMARFRPELEKLRYDPTRYKSYLEQLGVKYPTVR